MAAVTRLGLYGGSRGLYGSFAGKEPSEDFGSTVFSYGQERRKRQLLADEDDQIMAVIIAFLQIKDD